MGVCGEGEGRSVPVDREAGREPGVGFRPRQRQPEQMREAWTHTGRRETRRLEIMYMQVTFDRESIMTTAQLTTTRLAPSSYIFHFATHPHANRTQPTGSSHRSSRSHSCTTSGGVGAVGVAGRVTRLVRLC